jgi:glyoxylase-like metal-dependent hydrolase (beta-lactamase superfamily II)
VASAVTTTPLAGVHRLRVPTPFAIGDVNAFLLEGDPLTLVDNGPSTGRALLALERGLAELGYAVGDLELLLITHQHGDHLGLTEVLVDRSGASVACLGALAPYVADFEAAVGRDDDLAAELMLAHGVDAAAVRTVRDFTKVIRGFGASFPVDVPLADGDLVEAGGRSLRVLHRPGHSASDTVFVDEERNVALGGDHLLPGVSSNAQIAHPLDRAAGVTAATRPRALHAYMRSLRATEALDLDAVLPGHGETLDDPSALIRKRFAFHEERATHLLGLLGDEPRTAHELATEIWGEVAVVQGYLTTCEVLGHLELLAERGLVVEEDGMPIRFRRTVR